MLSGLEVEQILPDSDLVSDPDWGVWRYSCHAPAPAGYTLAREAAKLAGNTVDSTRDHTITSLARRIYKGY